MKKELCLLLKNCLNFVHRYKIKCIVNDNIFNHLLFNNVHGTCSTGLSVLKSHLKGRIA